MVNRVSPRTSMLLVKVTTKVTTKVKSYHENFGNLQQNPQSNNWYFYMKNILNNYDFSEVWGNQGLGNFPSVYTLSNSFKSKLKMAYETEWSKTINMNDGKLKSYKLFKKSFAIENYLLSSSFNDRKFFTKLRTSSHKLHIETGRHKRPITPREFRFCDLCKNGKVEDELHFLLNCNHNQSLRKSMLNSLNVFVDLSSFNNDEKLFEYLMSYGGGDTEVLKPLLKFLNESYTLRFP